MHEPNLQDLPPDALLTILSHLSPSDITSLQTALPQNSHIRALTQSPYLWHGLFQRHFPPGRGVIPMLSITQGRLDWCTAYRRAERRERLLRAARAAGWRMPEEPGQNAALRIVVNGNVRRLVSQTADDAAADVVTDPRSRVTRFDWTRRRDEA